jgi:hypothetical protein
METDIPQKDNSISIIIIYFKICPNIAMDIYHSKTTKNTKLNQKIEIPVEYTSSMQNCNIRNI